MKTAWHFGGGDITPHQYVRVTDHFIVFPDGTVNTRRTATGSGTSCLSKEEQEFARRYWEGEFEGASYRVKEAKRRLQERSKESRK